jgi:hypothetical protein
MNGAFKDLSLGKFESGLGKLKQCSLWRDDIEPLDGPFYLGFPGKEGWGEGLLIASLLKRHAANCQKPISVFARPQVCAILKDDDAFNVHTTDNSDDFRSHGARPPLAVLQQALLGNLLDYQFRPIKVRRSNSALNSAPYIGIAWASVSRKAVAEKSVPLKNFLDVLPSGVGRVVSFQRKLREEDRALLRKRFRDRCLILRDDEIEAVDQSKVIEEISRLACMITISTTTAHIAACLGIPVVLIAASRQGQQWFWQAQRNHGKCFYPNVEIIMSDKLDGDWWINCIDAARQRCCSTNKGW